MLDSSESSSSEWVTAFDIESEQPTLCSTCVWSGRSKRPSAVSRLCLYSNSQIAPPPRLTKPGSMPGVVENGLPKRML